jgi:alkanesulfonate monooxygenase SsuD/methylene tetrahydromethanopterin reductase-like flavin-dependent oxidoreductase (luciferase family)
MVTPEMLADSLARVRAQAEEAGRNGDGVRGGLFAFVTLDDDGERARRTAIDTVSATYHQDFTRLADRYLLFGRPEDVSARLGEYRDAGAESVIFGLACEESARARQLDMLAHEVCGLG